MNITDFDPIFLSRVQFAFTISFHILFPAFTIGLASWLAVVEYKYLTTENEKYKLIYKFWVKIFAVSFGMGVVSGVVMSYQFGTNWSVFSDRVGNVIGPLLGYEVLTAFFLEASFLGIMLFGWNRVSRKMHFTATCIVAVGTMVSAFWILSANSWMQTPLGFEILENGVLYPKDWIEIIFNPSFPYRFAHMLMGAYLTTAFVVGGVGAYYLYNNRHMNQARLMLGMAMIMAVFVAPAQIVMGDLHGLNTLEHQPLKVAAMEGIWQDEKGAALRLFAIPDSESESNKYEIAIPNLASLILTHDWNGEVKGITSWAKEDRPPIGVTFWSFRVMVAIGTLMALTGLMAVILYFRKRLFDTKWFQIWCMALTPSGFIAILAGWFVTEVGRQPFTVYNVLRTSESASLILDEQVAFSLLAFIIVYTVIFGAGTYYIIKLIRRGPETQQEAYGAHGLKEPGFNAALERNTPNKK